MNKKTKALTTEQYKEIIQTMKEGFCGCRPNDRIATGNALPTPDTKIHPKQAKEEPHK